MREARHAQGWSQQHLEGLADVDQGTISAYEQARQEPDPEKIIRLEQALGISGRVREELYGGDYRTDSNEAIGKALEGLTRVRAELRQIEDTLRRSRG